jgi:hypothetical protein
MMKMIHIKGRIQEYKTVYLQVELILETKYQKKQTLTNQEANMSIKKVRLNHKEIRSFLLSRLVAVRQISTMVERGHLLLRRHLFLTINRLMMNLMRTFNSTPRTEGPQLLAKTIEPQISIPTNTAIIEELQRLTNQAKIGEEEVQTNENQFTR